MTRSTNTPASSATGSRPAAIDAVPGVYQITRPAAHTLPVVLASPHSGRDYPDVFVQRSRLDARTLRRSEDCFVDEIFAPSVDLGVPLLSALFPRAYLDPNREPFEFDPVMFEGALPTYVNTRSPRVAAGLGTIPRIVAGGEDIYRHRLRFSEAVERVDRCYYPYHAALRGLVEETRAAFGYCILVDCHSMPSIGLPPEAADSGGMDMVLGDCFGSSCHAGLVAAAEEVLTGLGYVVGRNAPYAGGYTTRHYGRPGEGIHALQIELNRALYMDEVALSRQPYLDVLSGHMRLLVSRLAQLAGDSLRPRKR